VRFRDSDSEVQSSERECKCGQNSECVGVSAGCRDVKCEDDLDGAVKRVIAMKMEAQGIAKLQRR